MRTLFVPFKTRELSILERLMRLHTHQFELRSQYPTVRFFNFSREQFEEEMLSTYDKCPDPLSKTIVQSIIDSFDPRKHFYGELVFEVRCLAYREDSPEELFLTQNNNYPWTLPIGFLIDQAMYPELFRSVKTSEELDLEEGPFKCRRMEGECKHPMFPEWDAYTGVLKGLNIQERYLTDIDIAYKPKCKLETFVFGNFSESLGTVTAHRINRNMIYDVRMCNLTLDRYDRAVKLDGESELELKEIVEEFKEIKSWKDLPEKSSSNYIGQDQNFFGVDVHVTGDARARVTIADKQISLKYWNKEVIAALYVDAAIRTHKNFIKDWERKLNFPHLKQIVICVCPICLKGKKFPRRSSQFPDHLIYTKEYKEQFKPEEL